jgi:hypothetical protein
MYDDYTDYDHCANEENNREFYTDGLFGMDDPFE